jgi:MarR family transcriptional regulator, organic hydroperoxide resistance regulator
MKKTASRRTMGGSGDQSSAASNESFPPPTTTLQAFLKNGSDAAIRRLIYGLTSLFNQMVRNRKHFAAYIGVTEAQFLIMTIIAELKTSTVSEVAQRLYVSSQFITIEVGDLVRRGIVEKRPNEADRRSMLLQLSTRGEQLLRELAPLRRMVNDMHWRSLTEERAKLLQEIVDTLLADGRNALHELEGPEFQGKRAPSAR